MSVEVLRTLTYDDRALSIEELCVLLGGITRSGAHRYLEATELRFGQLVMIFRHAKSDRVREALLQTLLPGSGYQVIKLPEAFDFNGDGDVNDRDVLAKTNESIGHATLAIARLAEDDKPEDVDGWCDQVQAHLAEVIAAATAASAAAEHYRKHTPRRRSARPGLIGNGRPRNGVSHG